ncbi:MAG: enoyl-CoA hydratase-related protein [Novosphingobium sp.]|nr:enoyl-CoA hydratase-related protein [Novosphingobium sp.]
MEYPNLAVSHDGGLLRIELDKPERLNAIDLDMARGLLDIFTRIGDGRLTTRAVLLSGRGRAFCAGGDLAGADDSGEAALDKPLEDGGRELEVTFNPLMTRIRELPVPIAAAVQGGVVGVGMSLALACDLIVAADNAYFLQAFRHVGVTPDGGSTYMLPRRIGLGRALEMALLGERLPAGKALDWGVVNRVVGAADLEETAIAMVRGLADGPFSLGLTRQLMQQSCDASWRDQLHSERLAASKATASADFLEGVKSFTEKRKPVFTGE